MSGGPAGDQPACVGTQYGDTFFSPTSASTYNPGGILDISFYGGSSYGLDSVSQYHFALVLQSYRNSSSTTNIINTTVSFGSNWWTNIDACYHTKISYSYNIPQSFQVGSDPDFIILAYNASDSNVSPIATSDTFRITSDEATTSSSVETRTTSTPTASTLGPSTTAPITSPSASTPPAPAPSTSGLSTGAKIGLAVGVVLGVACLCACLWILWRRKTRKSKDASSSVPETRGSVTFEKPDLDSMAVPNASKDYTPREPVELA